VKNLLKNHGPLKKTWVTLEEKPSSGVCVNEFVLQALICKFNALCEIHMLTEEGQRYSECVVHHSALYGERTLLLLGTDCDQGLVPGHA
jgi:hypothetical protein